MSLGANYHPEKILVILLRIGAAILSVLFLSLVVSRVAYPFGSGTWEAFNWMPAKHLLEGANPYSYAFTEPYGMSPYGIVFYALLAVGLKFFGFQLWFGRLLSVAALLFCAFSVFKITKISTRSTESARLSAAAVLAMFPVQIWVGIMRPDLIAAAFSLAAWQSALTIEKDEKIRLNRIFFIAALSAAAFFTKPTYFLSATFVFLRFVQSGKRREAVLLTIITTIWVGAGIFLLDYTSSGGYIWQHFTHAEALPISFSYAVSVFVEMLKQPVFSILLIFAGYFIFRQRRTFGGKTSDQMPEIIRSRVFLVLVCFALSLCWTFYSAGRTGGNANYYIENSFLGAIVIGVIYASLRRQSRTLLAAIMILLLAFGGTFQLFRVLRGEYYRWQSLSYYREIYETVGRIVPPNSKCISVYPELVVWNGCRFNFDDFEEYVGNWSPELDEIFVREVGNGNYAAVIWLNDDFQNKFPNYRLVRMSEPPPEKFFKAYLYVRQNP